MDVSLEQARRVAVRAQLLDGSATTVLDTVRKLGFLQMDPIATVATPQTLVLFSRLGSFDTGELDRLLWDERKLIEYDAFIYPVEDLPVLRARMRQRRRGRTPGEQKFLREFLEENRALRRLVLRELERNGPLLSRQFEYELPKDAERHVWWGRGALRLIFEVLTARGEIAVAGRVGGHRLWDLAERVWPETETLPWREAEHVMTQQRRRALGVWKDKGTWHVHPDISDDPVPNRLTVLSPFDRLIHDRARAHWLWDFFYRLEMYVPKAKRQYGYYVLPVLRGDRIVARIEPVLDRKARELRVNGVWWEDGVKPVSLQPALKPLARWLGAKLV